MHIMMWIECRQQSSVLLLTGQANPGRGDVRANSNDCWLPPPSPPREIKFFMFSGQFLIGATYHVNVPQHTDVSLSRQPRKQTEKINVEMCFSQRGSDRPAGSKQSSFYQHSLQLVSV